MSITIHNTHTMTEGSGVRVNRLMPVPPFMNFDPFVLFDHFSLKPGVGFPEHPHRGFEAITYLFNGEIEHRDNLGNVSRIGAGGAQRFTAGVGLTHSEMPADDAVTDGIQLWINLAQEQKAIAPDYQEAKAEEIHNTAIPGGVMREIVGPNGPVVLKTPALYQHLALEPAACHTLEISPDWRGIIYLRDGSINVNQQTLVAGQAALVEDETQLVLIAEDTATLMIAAGQPHHQPIRQRGPYVD